MAGKPGRRWGELRGEYAEVRQFAGALRDIADSHGVTLRMLEARMPHGHSAISQNLNGLKRPDWNFVTEFLNACAGNDKHARAMLERKVRPLWEVASPARARRAAEVVLPPPAELQPWIAALREAADAQQVVADLQLSVGRHQALAGGLLEMVTRLTRAAETLTAERDSLAAQVRKSAVMVQELSEVRAQLDGTQQRLDAAERLLGQTYSRLDVAHRQLEEAERLKQEAMSQSASARERLAELEQSVIAAPAAQTAEIVRRDGSPGDLMGWNDQEAAQTILHNVDDTLGAEAVNLAELRDEVGSRVDQPGRELSLDNASTSPDMADGFSSPDHSMGQLVWTTNPTGHIEEDWPEAIQPADSTQAEGRWREGIASAVPFDLEYRIRAEASSYRYLDLSAIPIIRHGRVVEWSIACTEVTGQPETAQPPDQHGSSPLASLAEPSATEHLRGKEAFAAAGSKANFLPRAASASSHRGQIITFYSYKGGTGRTMAVANIAWILAANGYRVLAADWDLESPGLQRFFRPFMGDHMQRPAGVVDFIRDYEWAAAEACDPESSARAGIRQLINDHVDRLESYTVPLNWRFQGGGELRFLPPGNESPDYQAALSALDWDTFYNRLYGGELLHELRAHLNREYDYVLIDSRTGLSDIADICLIHLPDAVIDCFTLATQSIEGASTVANLIRRHSNSGQIAAIWPVPMRIDYSRQERVDAGLKFALRALEGLPARMSDDARRTYWDRAQVPYVSTYAYEESLAVFRDNHEAPVSLLASYERIVSYITNGVVTGLPPISDQLRRHVLLLFYSKESPVTYG